MRHAGGYKNEQAMICAMGKTDKKKEGHEDLGRAIKVTYVTYVGIITKLKCSPGWAHQRENHRPFQSMMNCIREEMSY